MNKDRIVYGLCSSCGYKHSYLEDGFGYLDCMLYYRKHLEKKEIKDARESKIEIWDREKKVWKRKIDYQ